MIGAIPSLSSGYARNAAESAYPQFWDKLVGAWPFWLQRGATIVEDFSGWGHRGTQVNAANEILAGGRYGRAFYTDKALLGHVSTNNRIDFGTSSTLGGFPLSVSFGFRKLAVGSMNNYDGFVSKMTDDNWADGWGFYTEAGNIKWFMGEWNVGRIDVAVSLSDPYYSITGTCDGTRISLYVDGYTPNSGTPTLAATGLSSILSLGRMPFSYTCQGAFDYLYIHKRVLSPSEIRLIHKQPYLLFQQRPRRVPGGTVYQSGITETSKGSDVVSAIHRMTNILIEAAKAGESWATKFIGASTLQESSLGSDAFTSLLKYASQMSEGGNASEVFNVLHALGASLSESSSASDIQSALLQAVASLSESGSMADTFAALLVSSAVLSEGGGAAESLSTLLYAIAQLSEQGVASDTFNSMVSILGDIADGAVASDAITSLLQVIGGVSDSGIASDVLSGALSILMQMSEGSVAADAFTGLLRVLDSISDAGIAADVFSGIVAILMQMAEGTTAADAISTTLQTSANLSETGIAAEFFIDALHTIGLLTENGTVIDEFSVTLLADIIGVLSEYGLASESLSSVLHAVATPSESASASESLTDTLQAVAYLVETGLASESFTTFLQAVAALSESAEVSDAFTVVLGVLAAISEGASASDAWVAELAGGLTGTLTDASLASDSLLVFLQAVGLLSESAKSSATFTGIARASLAISEISNAGAVFSGEILGGIIGLLSETTTASEFFMAELMALATLAESADLSSLFASSAVFGVSLSEHILAIDLLEMKILVPREFDEGSIGDDAFVPALRASPLLTDLAVTADLWQSQIQAQIAWAELVIAGDFLSVPAPFDVGLVTASIRIAAALSGSILSMPSVVNKLSVRASVDAMVDVNRHYND